MSDIHYLESLLMTLPWENLPDGDDEKADLIREACVSSLESMGINDDNVEMTRFELPDKHVFSGAGIEVIVEDDVIGFLVIRSSDLGYSVHGHRAG